MKRALLVALSGILLFISSCTKGPLIMSPAEKLQGEWYYAKAFYINNGGLFRDNVISDFVDCRITFNGNLITLTNLQTNDVLEGNYELYKADVGGYWDEDGNYVQDIERFLSARVYDTKTGKRFIYEWQINFLTRGKFNFGEYFADGNYSFKMRKIE